MFDLNESGKYQLHEIEEQETARVRAAQHSDVVWGRSVWQSPRW